MSDDEFSWGQLGRYLRDEETPEEKRRREEREEAYRKSSEELAVEEMERKRQGFTFGEDDASLEKQPPKPRHLKPEELKAPEPRKKTHIWWRKPGEE